MGELLVKDKEVVVPGEILSVGMDYLPATGTFREGENIIASKLGLASIDGRLIKLIPLSGKYLPKPRDIIIGKVIDLTFTGWRVDLNSAYTALLSVKDATSDFVSRGADLTRYYNLGDYMMAKIINVTSQNLVDLTLKGPGLRKLGEGRIIYVAPNKVPRIIGKQGSMVMMIKDYTKCQILVGQNGVVWISGQPMGEVVAVNAIRKIEAESHMAGLTERMKAFLESQKVG
jgi:exosome complex component RRP4